MTKRNNNVKIHIKDLCKSFGHLDVLNGISTDIYEGEVVWNETEYKEKIVSFSRVSGNEKITLYANMSKENVEFIHGERKISLDAYGYVIV